MVVAVSTVATGNVIVIASGGVGVDDAVGTGLGVGDGAGEAVGAGVAVGEGDGDAVDVGVGVAPPGGETRT